MKGMSADACHTVGDSDRRKTCAVRESPIADTLDTVRNSDGRKARAAPEDTFAEARDAVGDSDRRKARTIIESIRADARHAVRDSDGRKARAKIEDRKTDARDAVGDSDRRKARTIIECPSADARHAITDFCRRNVFTIRIPRGIRIRSIPCHRASAEDIEDIFTRIFGIVKESGSNISAAGPLLYKIGVHLGAGLGMSGIVHAGAGLDAILGIGGGFSFHPITEGVTVCAGVACFVFCKTTRGANITVPNASVCCMAMLRICDVCFAVLHYRINVRIGVFHIRSRVLRSRKYDSLGVIK